MRLFFSSTYGADYVDLFISEVYPVDESVGVDPETEIRIYIEDEYEGMDASETVITILGEVAWTGGAAASGWSGSVAYADDTWTYIIQRDTSFVPLQTVTASIHVEDGSGAVSEYDWWFRIADLGDFALNRRHVHSAQVPSDFSRETDVLNRKPIIEWVEPPIDEEVAEAYIPAETEVSPIEEARKTTEELIKSYNALEKLSDVVEKQIDKKVSDYAVQLDPVADYHVIEAIKRSFPDAKDPTKINFEMYKQCLARSNKNLIPSVTFDDIQEAKNEPLRTQFGGYGNEPGTNRPEVAGSMIKPVDLNKFQKSAVKKLWSFLQPLVALQAQLAVLIHKQTTMHGS